MVYFVTGHNVADVRDVVSSPRKRHLHFKYLQIIKSIPFLQCRIDNLRLGRESGAKKKVK